ncbi:MAG: SUMF1/EgtB/PvdO family nonheme iron enzyme [Verrucomicrobiales bacterium]
MVLLVIHDNPAVRQAFHAALTQRGFGPTLTASGAEEARAFHTTAGPAVEVIISVADLAAVVAEWRAAVGPVRAVFLAPGDLAAWATRLPGELLLPDDPLPIEAVVGWITAVAAEKAVEGAHDPEVALSVMSDSAPSSAVPPLGGEAPPPGPPEVEAGPPVLGDYELQEILREDEHTVTYRALQGSVQRIVVLERLRTAQASQPDAVRAFRALVRAQAAVVHPQIAAVYEAQEQDGRVFYTREWIEGKNLTSLRRQRQRLTQESVLDLLAAAAEAVTWLDTHAIPRRTLAAADVVLGRDGLPRIANIAAGAAPPFHDETAEIQALAAAAEAILDTSRPTEEFQSMAARVRDASPRGLKSWALLSPALAEARRRAAESRPPHTRRLSASTQEVVAAGRRRQRTMLIAAAAAAAVCGIALITWLPYWGAPPPRLLNDMVRIPAGSFIYQAGEMRELPEFWIGKYEVTIAQYAEFLNELAHAPGNRHDHPDQPSSKLDHHPIDWENLLGAALKGGVWRGQPIDVNCPITGVDYWDAWAYAHWRGCRLPTEEEWEKAGRATDGRLYPWGRDPDAPRANTGADYTDGPHRGTQDGHAGWAPVDAFAETDISPYGVSGLAGNVSEWTGSTMLHPEILDQQVPVLRGGSYASRPMDLTQRRPAASTEASDSTTGIRLASDQAR